MSALDDDQTAELAETFRLLGDPTRLRIMLAAAAEPSCVSDLAERAGASLSLASHHLRLLRSARLLKSRRDGKQVIYELSSEYVRRLVDDMLLHARTTVAVAAIAAPPKDV